MTIINIPISWPLFPILPLLNKNTEEIGLLIAKKETIQIMKTIFLCNVFDIGEKYINMEDLESKCPKIIIPEEVDIGNWVTQNGWSID